MDREIFHCMGKEGCMCMGREGNICIGGITIGLWAELAACLLVRRVTDLEMCG